MGDLSNFLTEWLNVSPPLALLIALNALMWMGKKTPFFENRGWLIPWLAVMVGVVVYPLLAPTGTVGFAVDPFKARLRDGLLIGLAAVGGHQWVIRTLQKAGLFKDDTVVVTHTEQIAIKTANANDVAQELKDATEGAMKTTVTDNPKT